MTADVVHEPVVVDLVQPAHLDEKLTSCAILGRPRPVRQERQAPPDGRFVFLGSTAAESIDLDMALLRFEDTGHHTQHRGLARSVRG